MYIHHKHMKVKEEPSQAKAIKPDKYILLNLNLNVAISCPSGRRSAAEETHIS